MTLYKTITMSLIGKNRVGLISNITKQLWNDNVNITKSNMIKLNDNFVLSMSANIPNKLNIDTSYFIPNDIMINNGFIKLENNYIQNASNIPIKINVSMADTPGIIHETTKILAENNLDISELSSDITPAPISGNDLFNLKIIAEGKPNINKYNIKEQLESLDALCNAEINIQ